MLLHLLCYRLGPLTTSWCMRMEAKNSYFKKIAQQGNFKNIALSVARRHQKLMCAILNDADFFGKMIIRPDGGMYTHICNRICKKGSYTRIRFCNFDEA